MMYSHRSVQDQTLDPQIANLTHPQGVRFAAIDGIYGSKFLRKFAGAAEFALDRSIERDFINLAVLIDIVYRVGIRGVEDLFVALCHANGFRTADVGY